MAVAEPLSVRAISAVALPIFQVLSRGGSNFLEIFGKALDFDGEQVIFAACRQYAQNYTKRYAIVRLLGIPEPVSLESIYTASRFLDDATISFESVETLQEVLCQPKGRSLQPEPSQHQTGLKLANEKQFLMVLGDLGVGKTTFLQWVGLQALKGKEGNFKHACIPVFIQLKRFNTGQTDIQSSIVEEFRISGFPSPEAFVAKALEQGKLLILLDGLDELPTRCMPQAISQIQHFADLHSQNRFIVSCRTAVYRHELSCFSDVAMADFDDAQIQEFITNWFRGEPHVAQDFWKELNHDQYACTRELAKTPFLLTFLCLLYHRSRQFPANRATLYDRALRVLLEELTVQKPIFHDPIYTRLDASQRQVILSELAYHAFQADCPLLPKRETTAQVDRLLRQLLPREKFVDGAAVLKSLELQHGVLIERPEGIYSFSHLGLQEYLTALYIYDQRQLGPLVTDHLTDERWQDVFLLLAGLMRGGADNLLLLMQEEAQKYVSNAPKLRSLLTWAEQVAAGSESHLKPVAKRAIALALALALPSTYITNLEGLKVFKGVNFLVLIAGLKALKAKLSDEKLSGELRRAFANQILETLPQTFHLNPELVNLSDQEAVDWRKYFYINYLIMRCKDAAVRVSPKTSQAIEECMLLVKDA